jgi:hypothetical protein
MEQGKVKWSVYAEYAKANNLVAVAVYLATLIAAQTAGIGKCPTLGGAVLNTHPRCLVFLPSPSISSAGAMRLAHMLLNASART